MCAPYLHPMIASPPHLSTCCSYLALIQLGNQYSPLPSPATWCWEDLGCFCTLALSSRCLPVTPGYTRTACRSYGPGQASRSLPTRLLVPNSCSPEQCSHRAGAGLGLNSPYPISEIPKLEARESPAGAGPLYLALCPLRHFFEPWPRAPFLSTRSNGGSTASG